MKSVVIIDKPFHFNNFIKVSTLKELYIKREVTFFALSYSVQTDAGKRYMRKCRVFRLYSIFINFV